MPVSLSALIAKRASACVDFGGGDVLNVEYYPDRLSGKMVHFFALADQIADLPIARAADVMASATDTLLTMLASWDLVDEAGAVLPIDRDTLDMLGLIAQWRIVSALLQSSGAGAPGEAGTPEPSSADSGVISLPTARRATR